MGLLCALGWCSFGLDIWALCCRSQIGLVLGSALKNCIDGNPDNIHRRFNSESHAPLERQSAPKAEDLFKPKQQTTRADVPTSAPNDASSAEHQPRRQPRVFAIPSIVPIGGAPALPGDGIITKAAARIYRQPI